MHYIAISFQQKFDLQFFAQDVIFVSYFWAKHINNTCRKHSKEAKMNNTNHFELEN